MICKIFQSKFHITDNNVTYFRAKKRININKLRVKIK
jgi:hypothetical protein